MTHCTLTMKYEVLTDTFDIMSSSDKTLGLWWLIVFFELSNCLVLF